MNRIDFINSFSSEAALAIQILIGVGNRASVNIETSFSRIDRRQARSRRALYADADSRLQDAISVDYGIRFRIGDGLIEWMCQGSDHAVRRSARQFGIGVERDHKADPG